MNRLFCKLTSLFILLTVILPANIVLAFQTSSTPATNTTLSDSVKSVPEKSFMDQITEAIIPLLIIAFIIFAIIYMVIEWRKVYFQTVTVDEMKSLRQSEGKVADSTPEEDAMALDYLNKAFESWSVVSNPGDEEEYRSPVKMREIQSSLKYIEMAKALRPTDEAVISRLNELGEVILTQTKRHFDGSWKVLGVAGLVLLLFTWMGSENHNNQGWLLSFLQTWWLWVSMIFYYFASYAPQFLIEKRARWFGQNKFGSALIGTVLGILVATPATSTVITSWSDGTTTKEEEMNPGMFIALAIAMVVLVFVGVMIIFFGLINFIRNYLLFF